MTDLPHVEHVARLPYAPPRHSLTGAFSQYLTLLRLFSAQYRTMWFFYIFFGLMWPVGFLFFLKMVEGKISAEQALFLLGGTMATSIAFGPFFLLINTIGHGRERHEFDYWATLPMPKVVFVLAIVSVSALLAFPGIVCAYVFGMFLLGLPFTGNFALLPLIPLGALPLAGLGALLGSYAPDGQTAGTVGNILTVVIGFLSPMFLPLSQLPPPLHFLALLIPTTYVADLFRGVLGGQTTVSVPIDILAVVVCTVGFLLIVHYKLSWRIGS